MNLTINGESRQFPAPLNLADLLAALGVAGQRLAVEKNGAIVPRSQHQLESLADGDVLEIVVAVGGG